MNEIIIRHVLPKDLDECYIVETSGFPREEAASRETIKLRMETFPQGFLVAEANGGIVGILNSHSTSKYNISEEELKRLIGHEPGGKNMVVFAQAAGNNVIFDHIVLWVRDVQRTIEAYEKTLGLQPRQERPGK